jgi:agmatine deiminase
MRFLMPAEWAPHRATWLAWPHETKDWPGKFGAVPWAIAEFVRHLSVVEPVRLLVEDRVLEGQARAMLRRAGVDLERVALHRVRTDRSWLRDSAPTFVIAEDGERRAVCWHFNAWAKYDDWRKDAKVSSAIARLTGVQAITPVANGRRVVLEGGAIDVDGEGTLICTEECLLSNVQARNPGLEREGIEAVFREYLGIEKVLWLGDGIAGDDTHGHVDDLCRFVSPGRVVLCSERNPADANYRALSDNHERLKGMRDAKGRGIDVISLPMPAPLYFDGQRLPASYANFYVANDLVLVPTFNDSKDREALGILSECFPGRRVVGIHAVDLVWGFGTLHCLSQQEPDSCPLSPFSVLREASRF